jgi:hypothetical protein
MKNKCSLKVVKDGKRLHGTAAILHMTSREGGFDKWLECYSKTVAKQSVKNFLEQQQKPRLKVM